MEQAVFKSLQKVGLTSFNEVFMTEARIPNNYVIGQVGNHWGGVTQHSSSTNLPEVSLHRYTETKSRVIDEVKQNLK